MTRHKREPLLTEPLLASPRSRPDGANQVSVAVEPHNVPGRTLDGRACLLGTGWRAGFAASIVAALVGTALMVAAPGALGAVPPDDRLILEGLWVTPDGRQVTVVQEGNTFTITGPPPAGQCPRPGGVFGTVAPTDDPSLYIGETFTYDTSDCSVTGKAPLQVKVTQDPQIPEKQSIAAESEGQSVGSAARPETNATIDLDGDGIPDHTEINGINVLGADKAGKPVDVLLNFPAMGANTGVRDVFVEVDSMPGRQYENQALEIVQDAFLLAPGGAINLHVDNGPLSVMNPTTGERWQERSEGTADVPYKDKLGTSGEEYSFAEFDALNEQLFTDARGSYFRYAIAANKIPSENDAGDESSGIARAVGATDFIVTTPVCSKKLPASVCTMTTHVQSAVFMHELGHTLGLDHGGDRNVNFKPNYFSTMNYSLAFVGLGPAAELKKPGGARHIDYSRFGPGDATRVDESQINEPGGVAVPNAASLSLVRYCSDPQEPGGTAAKAVLSQAGKPVDWNCNDKIDAAPFSFDVNFDGTEGELESFNDWANLSFARPPGAAVPKAVRQGETTSVPPQETMSVNDLLKQAARTLGDTKAPRLTLRQRGRKVAVTAKDNKRVDRLVVGVGRRVVSSPVKKTGRRLSVRTRLKRGRQRVTARAVDWVGNQSRPLKRKVRVR